MIKCKRRTIEDMQLKYARILSIKILKMRCLKNLIGKDYHD